MMSRKATVRLFPRHRDGVRRAHLAEVVTPGTVFMQGVAANGVQGIGQTWGFDLFASYPCVRAALASRSQEDMFCELVPVPHGLLINPPPPAGLRNRALDLGLREVGGTLRSPSQEGQQYPAPCRRHSSRRLLELEVART